MFHGPWLQVPVEQLAHVVRANLQHPRPHPYDPAVLQDALRVRRAVDEATDLAVRAASGLVSAPFSSRGGRHGGGGRGPGGSGGAGGGDGAGDSFGFGGGGHGGAPVRLSKERQFRMRDMAAQKLAAAYRCDEIATSVATMQSASSLDDVALHVLRRNAQDLDALYVHFFHEKIPSREVARCTPLTPLNRLILERPNDPAAYRTRALTKMFQDDHEGAVEDLTRGLAMCRLFGPLHDKRDLKEDEVDPQKSLEPQMLFHRANCFLHLACRHIKDCLDLWRTLREMDKRWEENLEAEKKAAEDQKDGEVQDKDEAAEKKRYDDEERYVTERKFAVRYHLDMRKVIKTNAKKAVRDYMGYLSFYDYFPGRQPSPEPDPSKNGEENTERPGDPAEPDEPKIYKLSDLFSSTLLDSLVVERSSTPPQSPSPTSPEPSSRPLSARCMQAQAKAQAKQAPVEETVSFHPLQPEALCALLLAHSLAQTPDAEIRRHANKAARLVRSLTGSPVFAAGAPAAGVDWADVLAATGNAIKMVRPWRALVGTIRRHAHEDDEGDEAGRRRWKERLIEYEAAREAKRGGVAPAGAAGVRMVKGTITTTTSATGETTTTTKLSTQGLDDDETVQARAAFVTALDTAMAEQGAAIKAVATARAAQDGVPPELAAEVAAKEVRLATEALRNMAIAGAEGEVQGGPPLPRLTTYRASDMTDEMFNEGADEAEAAMEAARAAAAATGGRACLHVGDGYGDDPDELYALSTERSQLIARWVIEAPTVVPGEGKKSPAARRKKAAGKAHEGKLASAAVEGQAGVESAGNGG
jgi:hypothetical protein